MNIPHQWQNKNTDHKPPGTSVVQLKTYRLRVLVPRARKPYSTDIYYNTIDRSTTVLLLLGVSKQTSTKIDPPTMETSCSQLSVATFSKRRIWPAPCLLQRVPRSAPHHLRETEASLSCMLTQKLFPFRRQNINETLGKLPPPKTKTKLEYVCGMYRVRTRKTGNPLSYAWKPVLASTTETTALNIASALHFPLVVCHCLGLLLLLPSPAPPRRLPSTIQQTFVLVVTPFLRQVEQRLPVLTESEC